jgi:hypothetical protein
MDRERVAELLREILAAMTSLIVPHRFCGPPGSGNGGYTCGLLAQELGGIVECTLRMPVPMDVPLEFERRADGGTLSREGKIVVEAKAAAIGVTPPAPISVQAATEAMTNSPALDPRHPFGTCFVCGPKRAVGDGLRIFPAPVQDGVFASAWLPNAEFGDGGFLRPEFLWAAMDCPTGFAAGFPTTGKLVTGRLAVEQLKPIRTRTGCVLMSWALGIEGRKHFSAACLYQGSELCAVANATWIRIES